MSPPNHLVIALDNDRSILTSLERLLSAHGHPFRCHDNPDDFFRAGPPGVPACLLLDQQLDDGQTGTAVHAEMHELGWNLPTIFLSAHGSIPLVVEAMRSGADGFLTKPYAPEQLLQEIERALDHSRSLIEDEKATTDLRQRTATLTPRERQVVELVAQGLLNKEIAGRLELALITVKVHRGRAMRKLNAGNAAELGKIAIQAGIFKPH